MTIDNVARGSASSSMTARAFLKRMLCIVSLLGFVVLLPSVAMTGSVPTTRGTGQCPCQCPNGRTVWINESCGNESDCYGPCGMTNSPSPSPGRDYGAEQREQEAAAAAEEQRRRDAELEQQRREAENKRRLEEIERQTKFLNDRDAAAKTLRGSTGTGTPVNGAGGTGLRGSTATGAASNAAGGSELRGSRTDTGLRGLKSGTTQTPNLDPMVVDARVAPMGAVLLAQVPELARSPAADRIRKGFQALMTLPRDWPVALAWWQEALQRDPNNAALIRSVDLAQWMVDSRKRAASRQSTSTSYPVIDALMRGDATEVTKLIEQAKIRNAIQDAEAERMTNIINKQVQQRAAAPALPKLSPKSASMVQMATAGDRALSEQMFEDGLLYLNAGLYEAAEQSFQMAGFFRNFDAGEPFSSNATTNKNPGRPIKKK